MKLKEILRRSLHPRFFYFLVNIKNAIIPNKSFIEVKTQYEKALKFYDRFIKPNDLVFDIGANYGNRLKVFLALNSKVIAVEPQKKCSVFLKAMYGRKATIIQKGAGAKEGSMDFYVSDNTALSTGSKEWIEKVKKTNRFESFEWNEPIIVPVTTLDKLIAEYGKPSFIKIDVEGLELDVLKGLKTAVKYISFEYAVPENMDALQACLLYTNKLGNYKINYSAGETMFLCLEKWLSATDFLSHIKTVPFLETFAGDIYLKLAE